MLREWLTRLRNLMSPKPNREIDDELRFHIEQQTLANIPAGMTAQEGRRKAVIAFAGIESVRAQSGRSKGAFREPFRLSRISILLFASRAHC
jgi:hypothetical protein